MFDQNEISLNPVLLLHKKFPQTFNYTTNYSVECLYLENVM